MTCKLCKTQGCLLLEKDKRRCYIYCPQCGLVFVPESDQVSVEQEKKRYGLHHNTTDNHGYLRYLGNIVKVIKECGIENPDILDFGSGKTAVLTSLLHKEGYECAAYDPLYNMFPNKQNKKYDIIVMCEVIEHVRDLEKEIGFLDSLLDSSGWLIIRTSLYSSIDHFTRWWYTEDITHINFFSRSAIDKLAEILKGIAEDTEYRDIFVVKRK